MDKKIFILAMILLMAASNVAAVDNNGDGRHETGRVTLSNNMNPMQSSTALSGCSVLVTGQPGEYVNATETRLTALGATVTKADPSTLTGNMLSQYDVVWIALAGADDVDDAGKADLIKEYVSNGGGLILEQPNMEITPQCLPYTFQITSFTYTEACDRTIIDSTHYLTAGLSGEEMPPGYDTTGTIGTEWKVLVRDGPGDPTLAAAGYGSGRVIVELGTTYNTNTCVCGGICQYDVMIERMVLWASHGCGPSAPEFMTPAAAVIILLTAPAFAYLILRRTN